MASGGVEDDVFKRVLCNFKPPRPVPFVGQVYYKKDN